MIIVILKRNGFYPKLGSIDGSTCTSTSVLHFLNWIYKKYEKSLHCLKIKKIKDFPCSLKEFCVCYWSSSFTCTSVLDSCREKGRYLGEVNAIYYHARPTCMLQFSLGWIKRDNSKSTVHLAPHQNIDCKKSIL